MPQADVVLVSPLLRASEEDAALARSFCELYRLSLRDVRTCLAYMQERERDSFLTNLLSKSSGGVG